MGKFSRQKGSREERALVAHLIALGYDAKRVPLSGAMKGYKFDVVATKDGVTHTFELKTRNSSFKTIYESFFSASNPVLALTTQYPFPDVAVGVQFEEVVTNSTWYQPLGILQQKVYKRLITTLKNLKGDADFLVIKDNHKPLLFIRYN